MTREFDFEEIKTKLQSEDLSHTETTELAEDLVSHVEYWMNAERTGTKFLSRKLEETAEELKKSDTLIKEYLQIGQRADAMIESRDKEIERLKNK